MGLRGNEEYRAALAAVRDMLERAGSARAVEAAELRARRVEVLTVVARQRAALGGGAGALLSPDMETLLERLQAEVVADILREPVAVVETPGGVREVAGSGVPGAAAAEDARDVPETGLREIAAAS